MSPWLLVVFASTAFVLSSALPAASLDLGLGANAGASGTTETGNAFASAGLVVSAGAEQPAGSTVEVSDAAEILASADAASRIETVIRLMENADWSETSFDGLASLAGSTAFDVDGWLTAETEASFESALEVNWPEVQDLQAAIDYNAAFSAWLEASGIPTETVVAVGQTADGSLAVFTSDG